MKRQLLLLLIGAILGLFNTVQAQNNVQDQLRYAEMGADMIREASDETQSEVQQLALQYFVLNVSNPNTAAYLNNMFDYMSEVEDGLDYLRYYLQQAAQANSAIQPAQVLAWANTIENLKDDVEDESVTLVNQINQNQTAAALATYQNVNGWLGQMVALADDIIAEFSSFYAATATFDVRIYLVDGYGNPVSTSSTGLGGFVAQNTGTNQYYYPDYYGPQDEFQDLPTGTYRFDSYPGYFDGTGSATLTLSPSLVQSDGFIHVTLQYWSE